MDTALYIDQNVSQACQHEFLKIWRVWIFLFKKVSILSQYPHQQKFFGGASDLFCA